MFYHQLFSCYPFLVKPLDQHSCIQNAAILLCIRLMDRVAPMKSRIPGKPDMVQIRWKYLCIRTLHDYKSGTVGKERDLAVFGTSLKKRGGSVSVSELLA